MQTLSFKLFTWSVLLKIICRQSDLRQDGSYYTIASMLQFGEQNFVLRYQSHTTEHHHCYDVALLKVPQGNRSGNAAHVHYHHIYQVVFKTMDLESLENLLANAQSLSPHISDR